MKKWTLVSLSILLALTLVLAGCSQSGSNQATTAPTTSTAANAPATSAPASSAVPAAKAQDGGVLRVIFIQAPQGSIGIPSKMLGLSINMAQSIIEPLLIQTANQELLPGLATGYQWSNEYKTLTLNLRKGVKFHDGTDFNAQAVKWNFDQNTQAKYSGTENIVSTEVVDDSTFRINLKSYTNTWLFKLAANLGLMISPTAFDKNGADYINWHPVGTGPFKFKEYKENDYLETDRFDGYWGGKTHLDGVKWIFIVNAVTAQIAFESKQGDAIWEISKSEQLMSDLMPKGYTAESAGSGLAKVLIPSSGNADSPLSNLKVRQAVEYAIDKDKLSKSMGYGLFKPLYQCALSNQIAFDPNFQGRVYDPAKAKQLLSEAGFPNGFKTKIMLSQNLYAPWVDFIQANLKAVGIDAEVNSLAPAKWIELETSGWPDGFVLSPQSPYVYGAYLERYWIKPTAPNWARGLYWTTMNRPAEMENAIQQYLVSPTPEGQRAKGREITKIMFDQAVAIPVFEGVEAFLVQKNVHDTQWDKFSTSMFNYTGAWLSK